MNSFDKIIGYESVKEELYQIIDMFKNQNLYKDIGAELPKGIIIIGNPGLGKTTLAEAFINECNVKTFKLIKNKTSKEMIEEINFTFNEASKEKQAIVFIDDIDKFSEQESRNCDDESFVAIQSGIDSVKNNNVLIIATGNNVRKLPSSLLRAGRIDRKICLLPPSQEDSRKIIEFYIRNKKVSDDLNYNDISKMINYTSCAELKKLINESAIYAAYRRSNKIEMEDILKACLRSEYSSPDECYERKSEDIESACYHEAGHLVISEILKEGSVGLVHVPVKGRGGNAGFVHLSDEPNGFMDAVLISLGGKVASEMFYQGKCAPGCQDDIMKAYTLIRKAIAENGTCGIGMIDVATEKFPNTSESMNCRNEAVVQAEFERNLFIVKNLLLKNKEFFFKVFESLMEKHTLLHSDIQKLRESTSISLR